MPNVVPNMVAARIIKQYVSYCKEIAFNHLSERELYRVLKYCPAQQKKHYRAWTTLALMDCVELRSLKMLSGSLEKGARVLNG